MNSRLFPPWRAVGPLLLVWLTGCATAIPPYTRAPHGVPKELREYKYSKHHVEIRDEMIGHSVAVTGHPYSLGLLKDYFLQAGATESYDQFSRGQLVSLLGTVVLEAGGIALVALPIYANDPGHGGTYTNGGAMAAGGVLLVLVGPIVLNAIVWSSYTRPSISRFNDFIRRDLELSAGFNPGGARLALGARF